MHLNGYCTCLSPMFDFSLGSAVFMVFSAQEIPARCFPSSKWLEGEGSGPATFVARPLGWKGPETSRFGGFVMDQWLVPNLGVLHHKPSILGVHPFTETPT